MYIHVRHLKELFITQNLGDLCVNLTMKFRAM